MVNPRKPVAMMKQQGKIDSAVKIQAQLKVRLFEVLVWYNGVLRVSRMEPGDAALLVSIRNHLTSSHNARISNSLSL